MAKVATPIRLVDAISRLADEAKLAMRPPPVISTDLYSALYLREMIHQDLGAELPLGIDYVSMYDGVKIVVHRKAPSHYSAWREHFGILAELEDA